MKLFHRSVRKVLSLGMMAILAGCASAEMNPIYEYQGPRLPLPARILVYDFSADHRDIPSFSPLKARMGGTQATPNQEQIDLGRQMGMQVANNMAGRIREMGLPGYRMDRQTAPRPGDLVLMGYFMSLDEGDAAKRVVVGFGSGAAELKVVVEGYQVTEQGMHFLGSGEGDAASGASPGAAVSVGVAIATANPVGLILSGAMKAHGEMSGKQTIEGASERITNLMVERLKVKFQQQGWIA
jgi:hypothetical protein